MTFDPATRINHLAAECLGRIFGEHEKRAVAAIVQDAIDERFAAIESLCRPFAKSNELVGKVLRILEGK